jgi:hypothetical protein
LIRWMGAPNPSSKRRKRLPQLLKEIKIQKVRSTP